MLKKKNQIVDLERELLYYVWIDIHVYYSIQRILPDKKIDVALTGCISFVIIEVEMKQSYTGGMASLSQLAILVKVLGILPLLFSIVRVIKWSLPHIFPFFSIFWEMF